MASPVRYENGAGDHSDEDSPTANSRKRSSRACDECRRTKSRCERIGSDGDRCVGCVSAGIACTYISPSYKRGPPKGYIHALEERRQQLELILGAIIASSDPHARAVIAALNGDDLAREVLSRVDTGPYGPARRGEEQAGSRHDTAAAGLGSSRGVSVDTGLTGPSRQPRQLRERVSSHPDVLALAMPAPEWQEHLVQLLHSNDSDMRDRKPTRTRSTPTTMRADEDTGSAKRSNIAHLMHANNSSMKPNARRASTPPSPSYPPVYSSSVHRPRVDGRVGTAGSPRHAHHSGHFAPYAPLTSHLPTSTVDDDGVPYTRRRRIDDLVHAAGVSNHANQPTKYPERNSYSPSLQSEGDVSDSA